MSNQPSYKYNPSFCVSTAISDLVLAMSSLYGLIKLCSEEDMSGQFGYIWFGLCLSASALGIFRFGKTEYCATLKEFHVFMSSVAGPIGLPCLASQYYNQSFQEVAVGNLLQITCILPILVHIINISWMKELVGTLVSVISILSLIGGGLIYQNMTVVYAGLCFVAAVPLDREEKIFNVPPVDIFHYLLTAANILLIRGLYASS